MTKMIFNSSPDPTLGVELEVALVDKESLALVSGVEQMLAKVPKRFGDHFKQELMQCFLEINTGICRTVADVEADLREKLLVAEGIADGMGLKLFWSATHPFSSWRDQTPSKSDRYARLLDILQDVGRQLVTFGLHVHVGVDSGGKAVMLCDRILKYLPLLLALSCNSPFWEGRVTGLQSSRATVMGNLPTAGLPVPMRNWSEYVWLVNHLVETGFINTIREIWWDVRPHHNFGTLEVRACDLPGNLDDTLAIVALIQCLIVNLCEEIDRGAYQLDYHPMMIRQNKWRASRYGLDAQLVDSSTYEQHSARNLVARMAERFRGTAERLGCAPYLERIEKMAANPTWADRQLSLYKETGDFKEVIRRMTELSRISARR